MARWVDVPISSRVLQNVDETALRRSSAALENAFINDEGGHTPFPGLEVFATVTPGPVYLHQKPFRGDLVASTKQGRVHRVSRSGTATDVTGFAVQGGRRATFAQTEDELLIAAGGPIVRLAGDTTNRLSKDAPNTTHVVYTSGYVLAIEPDSGRARYTSAGDYDDWPALNVFTAESKPDNLIAATVTPYDELLLIGADSVEQHDPSSDGDRPWFRRWGAGDGVLSPYTFVATKEGNWGVNVNAEFVRYINQTSDPASDDVQRVLDTIDNWDEAWAEQIVTDGQRFIVLQMPKATNVYGTEGVTLLFHQNRGFWYGLYDWDASIGRPVRWPGWSHAFIWGRHFVGGDGVIYEMKRSYRAYADSLRRYLFRTGHFGGAEETRIDDFIIRFKRGTTAIGASTVPILAMRFRRDNGPWSSWIRKSVGAAGSRNMVMNYGSLGTAFTWQWEWFMTDEADLEVAEVKALVQPV